MVPYTFNEDIIRTVRAYKKGYRVFDYWQLQRYAEAMFKKQAFQLFGALYKYAENYRVFAPKNAKQIPFYGYLLDPKWFKRG